jgi:hypothetical protein
MNTPSNLLSLLKNPTYLFIALGFSFLLFDLQYLMMARLPGYENEMCVMGAGLNPSNILFGIIISLMGGLLASGFIYMLQKRSISLPTASLSGIGLIVASMTVFCMACTLPVISLFGLAIGLHVFTDYNFWFKIVSIVLMGYALYDVNKQVRGICERCVE